MTTDFSAVKVVLLDVDNTLLDFQAAQKFALVSMLDHFGVACDEERIKRYDLLNKEYWKKFERGETTVEKLVVERFERFFSEEKIEIDPPQAERVYRENLGKNHDLVPGAMAGLLYLKEKYPVYLVTNGRTGSQKQRLGDSGISDLVDGVFISEEVGARKPDVSFFTYVFDRIPKVKREEIVIIGDGYSGDIAGGKNVGIRTVWYNPKGKVGTADAIVKDWGEIRSLL